jgi:hypothetical protein
VFALVLRTVLGEDSQKLRDYRIGHDGFALLRRRVLSHTNYSKLLSTKNEDEPI